MATSSRRPYAPRLPPGERREQLLDCALGLIAERGYGGVSMQAIAQEAGVTRPVVYDAFPNLGELLSSLLEREESRALAQLASVIPLPPPADAEPEDVLANGIVAFLRAVADHPEPWRLIVLPAEGTPRQVREHVERGRQAVLDQLERLIAWGFGRRGVSDLDTELAAQSLHAVGEHAARLVLTDPEHFPPERVGRFARALAAALLRS